VQIANNALASYPLGVTTVTYTGTDSSGNEGSCSTTVTVEDTQAPTIICPADLSLTSPAGHCSKDASFSVSSDDGCDTTPTVVCADAAGTIVAPGGHTYAAGTTAVTCTSTDDSGNVASCSFNVVVNDIPGITIAPASQGTQYSDKIADVLVTGTDCLTDMTLLSGAWPAGTSFGPRTCGANGASGRKCTWTLSGRALVPADTYDVPVKVNDGLLDSATKTIEMVVSAEDASVIFDAANAVSIQVPADGDPSGPFALTVHVNELVPDLAAAGAALPGDVSLADVDLRLVPVGPGGSVTGTCTPNTVDVTGASYADVLHVTCSFDNVPVNVYAVQATVNTTGYYVGSGEDVLTIFDPSLGFTTGGFQFLWPGTDDRTTGGYTMKYNKKWTKVQGSLLLIRHLADGTKYRIKSNALYGLALGSGPDFGWATFNGKSTYSEPGWLDAEGNHEFIVYVEDHGEPGASVDRLWLEVIDKQGNVRQGLSMAHPATANAETLIGGNIVVPHTNGGGGGRR
jgi:hypothetical protein